MSILQSEIPGARVLDLFAGSGALGLEALSRGAAAADLVEHSAASLAALKANIAVLGAGENARIVRADAMRFVNSLPPGAYDIAFADPPYRLGIASRLVTAWFATPFSTILSVEHARRDELPPGGDSRRFGDTTLTFFRSPTRSDPIPSP